MCTNDNLLSYKEIADVLKQDITQDEFMKIWETIAPSLRVMREETSVLEGLAYFDDGFIEENRFFIGDIFELAGDLDYVLHSDLFSWKEKDCIFNRGFAEAFLNDMDEESAKIVRTIFDVEDKPLEIRGYGDAYYSFESILQKFKILLDNENLFWVDYLKRAGELKPYDKEVVTYLLDYAKIIGDEELIKKYQQRLEVNQ